MLAKRLIANPDVAFKVKVSENKVGNFTQKNGDIFF